MLKRVRHWLGIDASLAEFSSTLSSAIESERETRNAAFDLLKERLVALETANKTAKIDQPKPKTTLNFEAIKKRNPIRTGE